MHKPLRTRDLLTLGLMTFSLFLGAGNLIFPPLLGLMAGDQTPAAITTFLLTAVGLPLLGLISISRCGGGLTQLTRDLPLPIATGIALIIYLALGPAFVIPRTAVVSFEMAIAPLTDSPYSLPGFTIGYFVLTTFLAFSPTRLPTVLGRVITPVLILVLLTLMIGSIFYVPNQPVATHNEFTEHLLANSFIQGYQTMDAVSALIFGMVIINALHSFGVDKPSLHVRYTLIAGLIGGVALAAVYISLAWIGASSSTLVAHSANGADVLNQYTYWLLGDAGRFILGGIVLLACLSTAAGLTGAFASYMSKSWPRLRYHHYVLICTVTSALVANLGLDTLIKISVPALQTLYPVAIGLIILGLARPYLNDPKRVTQYALAAVFLVSLANTLALSSWGLPYGLADFIKVLPFSEQGLGWLVPGALGWTVGAISSHIKPAVSTPHKTIT